MTSSCVVGHQGSNEHTIVVIEERTLFQECLARNLQAKTEYNVVCASGVEECVELCKLGTVASFLLCISDTRNAYDKCARLAELGAHAPTIVVAGDEEAEFIVGAIKSGVKGYIPTSMTLEAAIAAINFVVAGGVFVPASSLLNSAQVKGSNPASTKSPTNALFTARQASIVEALRQGKANKVIAYELNMCESTVKVHVRKIMRKLKASNRTQVAYLTNEIYKDRTLSAARA
ncbi:MAG: response regulator transcription factor [Hyphomicrobiaceae bacterium]